MLSFLDVPPDEALRRHNLRRALDQPQVPVPLDVDASPATEGQIGIGVELPTVVPHISDGNWHGYTDGDTHDNIKPAVVGTPTRHATITEAKNTTEEHKPPVSHMPTVGESTIQLDSQQATEASPPALTPSTAARRTAGIGITKSIVALPPTVGEMPIRPKRERIFRATLVQHGHSPAEQILYQALWNHGSPLADGSRQITAGYRELGYLTNLNDKTIKYNLQSLHSKLAIQTLAAENTFTRTGRTYKVFSYDQILQRRSHAGLVWVRKTKGVEFVLFDAAKQTAIREGDAVGNMPTVVPTPSVRNNHDQASVPEEPNPTVVANPMAGPELTTIGTGVAATTQLGNPLGTNPRKTTTTAAFPMELTKTLSRVFPAIDHSAIEALWRDCRTRAPDCTLDEVLYFVNQKVPISTNGRIQNPVGFLLSTVPKCFEGETFQHFRREQARLKEEQRRREDEERRKQQAMEEEAEQYRREEEASRKAEQLLPTLSEQERDGLYEQARAEFTAKGYKATGLNMEKLIQERVIRILARKILVAR